MLFTTIFTLYNIINLCHFKNNLSNYLLILITINIILYDIILFNPRHFSVLIIVKNMQY